MDFLYNISIACCKQLQLSMDNARYQAYITKLVYSLLTKVIYPSLSLRTTNQCLRLQSTRSWIKLSKKIKINPPPMVFVLKPITPRIRFLNWQMQNYTWMYIIYWIKTVKLTFFFFFGRQRENITVAFCYLNPTPPSFSDEKLLHDPSVLASAKYSMIWSFLSEGKGIGIICNLGCPLERLEQWSPGSVQWLDVSHGAPWTWEKQHRRWLFIWMQFIFYCNPTLQNNPYLFLSKKFNYIYIYNETHLVKDAYKFLTYAYFP